MAQQNSPVPHAEGVIVYLQMHVMQHCYLTANQTCLAVQAANCSCNMLACRACCEQAARVDNEQQALSVVTYLLESLSHHHCHSRLEMDICHKGHIVPAQGSTGMQA